jgi:hypothetical protein
MIPISRFNEVIPGDNINITATACSREQMNYWFDLAEGLSEALEMESNEAIVLETNLTQIIFLSKDVHGNTVNWKERWHNKDRQGIMHSLNYHEPSGKNKYMAVRRNSILEDIVKLRASRNKKEPAAWLYKVQPLLRRLVEASGMTPAQFLKSAGTKPGNIHNFPNKPMGVTRTIKAATVVPLQGRMELAEVKLDSILLNKSATLIWQGSGLSPKFIIQMQQPVPLTIQQSLIGTLARDLVDDLGAKAMFGDMTITQFTTPDGFRLELSPEDPVSFADEPEWYQPKVERLQQRLEEWAATSPSLQKAAA